jgi:hypothetical protein
MFDYDKKLESGLLECDACGYEEEFFGSFQECIDEAKQVGWKLRKIKVTNEWEHYCPDCSKVEGGYSEVM